MTAKNYFLNYNPVTGEEIGKYSIPSQSEIIKAKKSATEASQFWKDSSFSKRSELLKEIRKKIIANLTELIETICLDTGKVQLEALMADIYPSLEILYYYEKNLADILQPEKRKTPLTALGNKSWVEYYPRGVVAIISPWNYPFQLSLVPIITAIAAGNAVIYKPSEETPLTGEKIADLFADITRLPSGLLQIIQGPGEVGKGLIESGPDMIFFTGSVATGKKIMAQAAKKLIPVELELGGKDPFIVLKDAPLARAATGAVYGAFANTGQLCVGAERFYVQEEIAEEFKELVKEKTKELRVNQGPKGDIGPLTTPQQKNKIIEQVEEALAKGANIIEPDNFTSSLHDNNISREEAYPAEIQPVILDNLEEDLKILQEETFGPVMPILTFSSVDEVIQRANNSHLGLNSSVWSKDRQLARRIARELETGNCMINDVIKNVGNPYLPFGGVKMSGIGRYHGPEGLKNFSNTKSIMLNKSQAEKELNWFPFKEEVYQDLKTYLENYYGDRSLLEKISGTIPLLLRFLKG